MELDQILARLADSARQSLQADAAAVRLLDEEKKHLIVAAFSPSLTVESSPIALTRSPLDEKALSGQTVIVDDARADPQATSVPREYASVVCVPLVHEGTRSGVLYAYSTAPQRFCDQDAALLAPLADLGAAAIAATRAVNAMKATQASKAHFIHVATHELRSPVAVSQSLVRGVLKGYAGKMSAKQGEIFGRVSRRLDFLESLVNDLLDLAAGKAASPADEEAVALNASVGRTVLSLQPQAEEKGVNLAYRACCEELVLWGTDEGLDRIFVNLVGNAIKYTPTGGNVTVAIRMLDDIVEVQVSDDGIGIPEDALPHLFEEFYRAPNAKASDIVGTGLGLAIVQDLVEQYHGCIEVQSVVGQGSTFRVTFPLFPLDDDTEGGYCRLPAYLERS